MGEEDIRKYLARQPRPVGVKPMAVRPRTAAHGQKNKRDTFSDFSATHLFCPKCKQAMPVREKLLLFLPTGNLYDYCCERCGTSVGTRRTGL
jgi:hypothetical protein